MRGGHNGRLFCFQNRDFNSVVRNVGGEYTPVDLAAASDEKGWYMYARDKNGKNLILLRNSNLEQFATSVSTVANTSVQIQGAPATRNYIPVVIGHSSTVSCNETISWESGKWYIYSTSSQAVTVNFLKYPN